MSLINEQKSTDSQYIKGWLPNQNDSTNTNDIIEDLSAPQQVESFPSYTFNDNFNYPYHHLLAYYKKNSKNSLYDCHHLACKAYMNQYANIDKNELFEYYTRFDRNLSLDTWEFLVIVVGKTGVSNTGLGIDTRKYEIYKDGISRMGWITKIRSGLALKPHTDMIDNPSVSSKAMVDADLRLLAEYLKTGVDGLMQQIENNKQTH